VVKLFEEFYFGIQEIVPAIMAFVNCRGVFKIADAIYFGITRISLYYPIAFDLHGP
jgi:hypothetical protein